MSEKDEKKKSEGETETESLNRARDAMFSYNEEVCARGDRAVASSFTIFFFSSRKSIN